MRRIFSIVGIIMVMQIFYSCKKEHAPTVATAEITNITGTSATSGGDITDEGSGTVLSRGVCWSKNVTPSIADSKTSDGAGAGIFSSNLSDLDAATTYYLRAYATNDVGIGYGMTMSFTTQGATPSASISAATNITTTTATLNGSVNANYLSTTVSFEFGTTTSYGESITFIGNPVTGNLINFINADISELNPGSVYHFRIKAENSLGIFYSDDMSFTTLGQAPAAVTHPANNIMATSVRFEGTVNANFLSTVVTFEYGTATNYGTSIVAKESPVTGSLAIEVSANLTGLLPNTTYYFRVKAVNALGITYGSDVSFTTHTTITDVDGNNYSIVTIGTQTWMQENLRTTRYNDNTPIPYVTDPSIWSSLSTPGYCFWLNDPSTFKESYGALYNWYTVNTGILCPIGWHVPSNSEWSILDTYLGGLVLAGPKLMEVGIEHWPIPNDVATNESGFTGRPSGYRNGAEGNFYGGGTSNAFVTSTSYSTAQAYVRSLYSSGGYTADVYSKRTGYGIRCIKD